MDIKSLHHVDQNTPQWVQHLGRRTHRSHDLQVDLFFDPNGHRLELAVDTTTPAMKKKLAAVSNDMLKDWSKTKRAPHHADWIHKK